MYQSDEEHDNTWRNYINAAEVKINEQLGQLKPGEEILWAVEQNSYQERGVKDQKDYVAEIKASAAKFGNKVRLVFVSNKYGLASAFNYDPQASGLSRGASSRSSAQFNEVDFYGHGKFGMWLPYTYLADNKGSGKNREWAFRSTDITMLYKSSVTKSCRCVSYACNSATMESESSFTKVWQDYFGVQMYGVEGQTTYGPTGQSRNPLHIPRPPALAPGAKWVPSNPNPPPTPSIPNYQWGASGAW